MHPVRFWRDFDAYQANLDSAYFRALLRRVLRAESSLPQVESWGEVLPRGEERPFADPTADRFLRAILRQHAADRSPHWIAVLLPLFWPRLLVVWRRRLHAGPDGDSLWEIVLESFVESVEFSDLGRRGRAVEEQLYWDTDNRVLAHCRRLRVRTSLEPLWGDTVEAEGDPLGDRHVEFRDPRAEADFEVAELRAERTWRLRRLQGLLDRGLLSPSEHALLLGVEIYGLTVRECAHKLGEPYERVRKRHQRLRKKVAGGCPEPAGPLPFLGEGGK